MRKHTEQKEDDRYIIFYEFKDDEAGNEADSESGKRESGKRESGKRESGKRESGKRESAAR